MRRRRTHICEIMVIMLVITAYLHIHKVYKQNQTMHRLRSLWAKESYEYKLLSDGKNKVKLTKTEMAKAAALSIDRNEKNQIKVAEFGEDNIYKISNKKLKAGWEKSFWNHDFQ